MANILTGCRILFSIGLIFTKTLSTNFYIFYILAGITDVLDGFVARKSNTVSKFGTVFDTIADICFVGVTLYKVISMLQMPIWLIIWLSIIVVIKVINIAMGFMLYRKFIAEHTIMNKIMGILLFVFPMSFFIIKFEYSAALVCFLATISAIQEGYYIRKGKIVE